MTTLELYNLVKDYDDIQIEAMTIFCKGIAEKRSTNEAANEAADYLETCAGYEDIAESFRNHWKEV